MSKRLTVLARVGRDRVEVLVDEHVDMDVSSDGVLTPDQERFLSLLRWESPLSRALLDGGGRELYPRRITVLVDGEVLWSKECSRHGQTALCATTYSPDCTVGRDDRPAHNRKRQAMVTRDTGDEYGSLSEVDREVAARLAENPPSGRLERQVARPNVCFYRPVPDGAPEVRIQRTETGVPDAEWCAEYCPGGYEARLANGFTRRWAPGMPALVAKRN